MSAVPQERYCLFDTALGPCGIAWRKRSLARLQLPEGDRAATEERLRGPASPAQPPAWAWQVIAAMRRYLAGERVDVASVGIDLAEVGAFRCAVYEAARAVGWGQTASCGELGARDRLSLGRPGGWTGAGPQPGADHRPLPSHPTHDRGDRRVLRLGGTLTKQRLLALEGVQVGTPLLPGL